MPSVVICDPFSNGGQADPKNGIKASLHYFEVGDSRISSVKTTQNFAAGMAGVVTPNTTVYMNYLNVPTRSFSDGFVTDGGDLMRTMSGDPLIEWFSLRMESNLTAPSVAEEGWYQFAMNADDGAILKVDPNKDGVFDTLVDNDGIHAPALKCASKAIYLEAGKPIPFKLNYFQGPRYHITMQLLWRKVSGPSNNLSCNANSLSPVPVKAFELEPGRPNPCADASNPGSSVLEDDVLDQYGCGEKADKKVLVCKGPAGNSNNSVEVCVALQAAINGHQTPLNGSVGPTGNHLGACK